MQHVMAREKVVQTELDAKEYELLSSTAKTRGLTIKEAARKAIVEWAISSADISGDPLLKLKPFRFRTKMKSEEIEKVLYGEPARSSS